jgi:PAS domain S-box-containing protein
LGTDSTHIKVLHIDDEADQCTFTKTFLEQLNPIFQVTSTEDPAILVHELNTGDYDCVVSDFKMPQVNGIQLARSIREFSSIPFILYTGQGSEEVAEEAFAVGVNYYVRKEMGPSHYQLLERSILTAVEKHRVEERLRQSQRELSWMVDNTPDAIIRIEMGVGVVRCNPAAENMLDIQRGTNLTFEEMIQRMHPEDRQHVQTLSQSILESHKQGTISFRWIRQNGGTIWIEANIIPIVFDRKPIGVEIVARDITIRKAAERELQEQREHFKQLFNFAVDPLMIIDGGGRLVEVSDRVEEVIGFRRDEVIGKRIDEMGVIPSEKIATVLGNLKRRIAGERVPAYEITLSTKSGEKIPFEIKAEVMYLNGSTVIMASFRDIRDRKRDEAIIRRRLEIEKTMSAVASLFVGLQDIDTSIGEALKLIGQLSGASRAYLFKYRADGEAMDNTHEWYSPGVASEKQTLQGLPRYMFPWWMNKLEKGENLHIRDVSKMPPEAATEKMLLETQGIKSLLVIPFYIDKTLDGFIGFDNVVNTGKWGKDDLMLLRLSADLIGAAMLRQRIKDEKIANGQLKKTEKVQMIVQ